MRLLQVICGMASLALAGLLCVPAAFCIWQAVSSRRIVAAPGSLPQSTQHVDFILSVGNFAVTGWQIWAFIGGLAAVGLFVAGVGVYALTSREADC